MLMGGMAVMLLFGLTACGGSDYDNSKNDVSAEPSPTEESSNEEVREKSYDVEIDGEGNGGFEASFDGYGNEIDQEEGVK